MAQATLQLCPRAGPHRKVFLEQEEEPGRMAGVMQRLHGYKNHIGALPPGTLIIGALSAHHTQPTQRPLRERCREQEAEGLPSTGENCCSRRTLQGWTSVGLGKRLGLVVQESAATGWWWEPHQWNGAGRAFVWRDHKFPCWYKLRALFPKKCLHTSTECGYNYRRFTE